MIVAGIAIIIISIIIIIIIIKPPSAWAGCGLCLSPFWMTDPRARLLLNFDSSSFGSTWSPPSAPQMWLHSQVRADSLMLGPIAHHRPSSDMSSSQLAFMATVSMQCLEAFQTGRLYLMVNFSMQARS